jgi:hypothetical protein
MPNINQIAALTATLAATHVIVYHPLRPVRDPLLPRVALSATVIQAKINLLNRELLFIL